MVPLADCARCPAILPAGFFAVSGRRADGSIRRHRYCPKCKRDYERAWAEKEGPALRARRRARRQERMAHEPGFAEKQRARSRANARRHAHKPDKIARVRESSQKYLGRKSQDPAWRAARATKQRDRRVRLKAEDPEAYQALLKRERAVAGRRKMDSGKRKRDLENRRIAAAIRRERAGASVGTGTPRARRPDEPKESTMLPIAPALAYVEEAIAEVMRERFGAEVLYENEHRHSSAGQVVCERLGISDRTLFAWRKGERVKVQLDTVDQILTACGDPAKIYTMYPELAT